MNLRLTAKRCFYYSAITLFFTILSCTRDSYEKGEGKYSQMRGDFAEMHIDSDKKANAITTDDGDLLPLKELFLPNGFLLLTPPIVVYYIIIR